MTLQLLFENIFQNYRAEFNKNNKTSNPYFKELKNEAQALFRALADKYNLSMHIFGGQGVMSKNPYISFLAEGHKTSKGLYPSILFDLDNNTVSLRFGHAYQNPPDDNIIEKFLEFTKSKHPLIKNFQQDGYPIMIYDSNKIRNDVLWNDLELYIKSYKEFLELNSVIVNEYLESDDEDTIEIEKSFELTQEDFNTLIDSFLLWYEKADMKNGEFIDEYNKFSEEYFTSLTDNEFVELFFKFAHNGGFIQSGGERTAPKFKEVIQKDIDVFRNLILNIYNENFDIEKWWSEADKIKYFGKGMRSIFLHRAFPQKYSVYNNKSETVYRMLNLLPERYPKNSFRYRFILNAATNLMNKRPNALNLYRVDCLTHFLIGTEEGKKVWSTISKNSDVFITINNNLVEILENYQIAKHNKDIRDQINSTFKNTVKLIEGLEFIFSNPNLIVKFGIGMGSMANVPWIAILDQRETSTTQKGIYCVYLFQADMQGIYLTLIQGVGRTVSKGPSSDEIQQLLKRANEIKEHYGDELDENGFEVSEDINLHDSGPTGKAYEKSTICHKYYSVKMVKSNTISWDLDLSNLLLIYKKIIDDKFGHDVYSQGVRYWIYAPGDNASKWEEFYSEGIMGIGWDFMGNFTEYTNIEAIRDKLKKHYNTKSSKKNDTRTIYDFANSISIGDIIIPKKGKSKYLGYGIVTSDYIYDETKEEYKSIRKVDWKKNGEWKETKHDIVTKTLTDITKYPDYIERLINLIGIENKIIIKDNGNDYGTKNYWWLNANPKIWDLASTKVGEKQTYTAYNEKGNKRQKFRYFDQVKPGDKIIGYIATPIKEINSILEVTKELYKTENNYEFEFKKIEDLLHPISYQSLKSNPNLKQCEPINNNQGSLFKVTEEEYEIIQSIIDDYNPEGVKEEHIEDYAIDDAMKDLFMDQKYFEQILATLKRKKNIILQGAPGVGKTFIAKRIAYTMMGKKDNSKIETIQFHQSYSYEDFIQGYRPNEDGKFDLTNGIFYNFCKKAQKDEGNDYFFIIDEINRGNLSKIFGELMMLIEHDKRGEEFSIPLTYSSDTVQRFYIPSNMHIIGTMNTADRSLALVDYALRRRFSFIELNPEFNAKFREFLNQNGISKDFSQFIIDKLLWLNAKITNDTKNLGKGYCIGHSYFCTIDSMDEKTWFEMVIKTEIEPLLKEYWFDDINEVEKIIKNLLT